MCFAFVHVSQMFRCYLSLPITIRNWTRSAVLVKLRNNNLSTTDLLSVLTNVNLVPCVMVLGKR